MALAVPAKRHNIPAVSKEMSFIVFVSLDSVHRSLSMATSPVGEARYCKYFSLKKKRALADKTTLKDTAIVERAIGSYTPSLLERLSSSFACSRFWSCTITVLREACLNIVYAHSCLEVNKSR